MTYPIQNWIDKTQYPQDPLSSAPAEFIEKRRKCNYSKDEISLVFWHWEFLRRHKLYQEHWASDSNEYFFMFGVCGTFRPDPKTDCPADLLFRYELFCKNLYQPTFMNLQKPWAKNVIKLKLQYDFLTASKSVFELFMASGYVPWPELKKARQRKFSEKKYFELLQVLDALAEKESLTKIARKLRPSLRESALYNAGLRLRKSALDLQAALTGLPRMDEPDI